MILLVDISLSCKLYHFAILLTAYIIITVK
jgi:hypothetical protein